MRLASGYDVERLNARSRAYNEGKVATAMDFVYVNGKPVTCRRCKRKRVKSEKPEHLQFKTCNPCRVIERAQKRRGHKITLYRNREEYEILRVLKMLDEGEPYQTPDEELAAMGQKAYASPQVQYTPPANQYTDYVVAPPPPPVQDESQFQLHTEFEKQEREERYKIENNGGNFGSNALLFTPTMNPLSLPTQQQYILQQMFLQKYRQDKEAAVRESQERNDSPAFQGDQTTDSDANFDDPESRETSPVFQKRRYDHECVYCYKDLSLTSPGSGICDSCLNKDSVIKVFDYYLMLLKMNQNTNLENVVFSETIGLDKLLKSSMSKDTSAANIVLKLYEKFVMPISKTTGYDFSLQPQIDFNAKYASSSPLVIREYLKCTDDNGLGFEDDNIDSELIALQKAYTEKYLSSESCSSSLFLSYHTETGQLVISFTHKAHAHDSRS